MRPPWWRQRDPMSLADGAREGNRVDLARTPGAERRRGCAHRGARGVHVVDERDAGRDADGRAECSANVRTPLQAAELRLAQHRTRSREERLQVQLPAVGELPGEPLRRMVAA